MCVASFHSFDISCEGTLLACYEVPGGPRELVAYQEAEGIALFDHEPGDSGRGLFIDRGFFSTDGLEGLVAEYVRHAQRVGASPCAEGGFASIVNPPMVDGDGVAVSPVRLGTGLELVERYEILLRDGGVVEVEAENADQAHGYAMRTFHCSRVALVDRKGGE